MQAEQQKMHYDRPAKVQPILNIFLFMYEAIQEENGK